MDKKILLWIVALFLVVPFSFAHTGFNDSADSSGGGWTTIDPLNLTTKNTENEHASMRANLSRSSGKYYFEVHVVDRSNAAYIGIGDNGIPLDTSSIAGDSGFWGLRLSDASNNGNSVNGEGEAGTAYCSALSPDADSIISVYANFDDSKIWFAVNGTVCNSGDVEAGTGEAYSNLAGELWPAIGTSSSTDKIYTFNFTNFVYSLPDGYEGWESTPTPPGTPTKAFTITANDTYDGVSLTNITVNISNSSFSFVTSTVNGTLHIDNRSVEGFGGLYQIDFQVNDSGGYFNNSFTNVNISNTGSFKGSLFQSVVFLQVLDALNNESVTDFTARTNNSLDTTNSGELLLLLKDGYFGLNITASNFDNLNTNVSVDPLENKSFNVSMGSVFKFFLVREQTNEAFDWNSTNETKINVFCPNETITIVINNTDKADANVSQIINCEFSLMQAVVDYGDTGSYFRTLIPDNSQKNITWYLIDLNAGDTAIQRILELVDLTGDFQDSVLTIKRAIAGIQKTIINQKPDISQEFNLFLVKDELYTISISNGVQDIVLGNLIPTEAGTQTITLPNIEFVPTETTLNKDISWSYYFNETTGLLRAQYNDKTNKTTLVRFTIKNESNSQLFQGESQNNSTVTLTFNQIVANRTYLTELFIEHPDLNNFTDEKIFLGVEYGEAGAIDFQGWSSKDEKQIKFWVAIIFLGLWGLLWSSKHAGLGMVSMSVWMWIFQYWEWLEIEPIVWGFVLFLSIGGYIFEQIKRK